ncbi:MAG: hypothetical protein LGR52_12830 [Candidatus Thiosymbion ectosymbiont of Robbea hypermnestra]|nr:hypothetical protein [Candidatus Thiosymbion ectosymbiont of Robbea hypermnestra]
MLLLREEQLRALSEPDFERRALPELCAHLREHYGARLLALDEAALCERVRTSVAAAEGFGLVSRNDLYGFVTLDLICAEGFYRDAEVRRLLEASRPFKHERMLDLMRRLPAAAWSRLCTIDFGPYLDAAYWPEGQTAPDPERRGTR